MHGTPKVAQTSGIFVLPRLTRGRDLPGDDDAIWAAERGRDEKGIQADGIELQVVEIGPVAVVKHELNPGPVGWLPQHQRIPDCRSGSWRSGRPLLPGSRSTARPRELHRPRFRSRPHGAGSTGWGTDPEAAGTRWQHRCRAVQRRCQTRRAAARLRPWLRSRYASSWIRVKERAASASLLLDDHERSHLVRDGEAAEYVLADIRVM